MTMSVARLRGNHPIASLGRFIEEEVSSYQLLAFHHRGSELRVGAQEDSTVIHPCL